MPGSALFRLLAALTAFMIIAPASAASSRYMDVELVAETLAPRPGTSVLVGLKMNPKPGWHGYWSNAGDSGLAPTVRWTAPRGVEFGRLQHPAPTLLRVAGLTSYVHGGPHVLLARMTVSRTVPSGTPLPIMADINFAVCSDRLCVPQRARLSIQLVAGDGKPDADAIVLKKSLAGQPKPLSAGVFDVEDGLLTLQLPASGRLKPSKTRFFPDENGYFDAARVSVLPTAPVRIVSSVTGDLPKEISGVVSDGLADFRVRFRRRSLAADAAPFSVGRDRAAPKVELDSRASTGASSARDADDPDKRSTREDQSNQSFRLTPLPVIAGLVSLCALLGTIFWHRRRNRAPKPMP